ncbi:MAG: hypothetical protein R3277_03170 [Brumimicrobium sp.]|nr:hypothetical protein [Brumimicrobium sp.]
MYSKILAIFSLLITGAVSYAQISTNSPYSSQGIGDISFYGNAYMSGLGGSSVALIDSTQSNLMNPSSYSHLAKQTPLFSTGITHVRKTFIQGDLSSQGNYSAITHFSLIVPFADRLGLAFGMKPFSRSGYDINTATVIDGDSIFYDYEGSGAIQEFVLGFSGQIIKKRNHSLTLGLNVKHYFGNVENLRRAYTKQNIGDVGGMDQRNLQARAFGGEVGLNYRFIPSKEHLFTFGAVYRPQQNLNFIRTHSRIFYSGFTVLSSYDTIVAPTSREGTVTAAQRINVGFSYELTPLMENKENNARLPKFLFTTEFTSENWSAYRETFNDASSDPGFKDLTSFRFGFEYVPHRIAVDRSNYIKTYHKFHYRLGAYSINTPYSFNDEQITDQGLTVGLGIPIVINRSISMINFSASYGDQNAKNSTNVIRETYFGFNLGINIAPSYDRWFKKYKLD